MTSTLVAANPSTPSAAGLLDLMKVLAIIFPAYITLGMRVSIATPQWLLLLVTFSPLAGGVWLGLRGHRLPRGKYIVAGLTAGAIASTNLIFTLRANGPLLEMSSRNAATLALAIVVLLAVPVLQLLAGAEVGESVESIRRRKKLEEGPSVSAVTNVVSSWELLIEVCKALVPLVPLIKYVVCAFLIFLLALLAKF